MYLCMYVCAYLHMYTYIHISDQHITYTKGLYSVIAYINTHTHFVNVYTGSSQSE
ncbi:hypothetical protein BDB01DRAFT_775474 [Pilobolus umbonatus]|nr:hypothetical protein BDB01DRAFT_775474 [Pilobolus umbonatus]